MDKIIFAKVSDERDDKFKIITKICKSSNQMYVRKYNITPEGRAHLLKMKDNEAKLSSIYQGVAHFANATVCDNYIEFEYIDGVNLDEKISHICDSGDIEDIIDILDEYYKLIWIMKSPTPFTKSNEFMNVFGDVNLNDELDAGDFVNIDLIPANIITNNDAISIFDYEWVFDFSIPLEYVFFKGLFSSMHFAMMDADKQEMIYDHFGLTPEKRKCYLDMEISFQKYVSGTAKTLRDYSDEVPFNTINIVEIEDAIRQVPQLKSEAATLRKENDLLRAELKNIRDSKSWKILHFLGITKG